MTKPTKPPVPTKREYVIMVAVMAAVIMGVFAINYFMLIRLTHTGARYAQ
jgi:hypothetical protein